MIEANKKTQLNPVDANERKNGRSEVISVKFTTRLLQWSEKWKW